MEKYTLIFPTPLTTDAIFPTEGAYPYQRDLKDIDFHLLDTGHFALEEEDEAIANYIRQFLTSRLQIIPA